VRTLADELGVNRNTVVAAYRLLTQAGLVEARGAPARASPNAAVAQEGFARGTVCATSARATPTRHSSPTHAALGASPRPVLYGEPVIDRDLGVGDRVDARRRRRRPRAPHDHRRRLRRDRTPARADADARRRRGLEDPCFLASLNTVRLGGYRPIAVPVDDEGMTVAGLRRRWMPGCAPSARRARRTPRGRASGRARRGLRAVLADHPYVLVIEDDHFSLSAQPFHSVIGRASALGAHPVGLEVPGARHVPRRGRLRPDTAERLASRLNPGRTWVSHLLQRLALEPHRPTRAAAVAAAAPLRRAQRRARRPAFTAAFPWRATV
jgi:hypothetical protein